MAVSNDLVASWDVPLSDKVHKVQFEHGTTSGKRVIWVDGKEVMRTEWMFKLVGKEHFQIGKIKCTISIDAVSGFAYEYTLEVNGKSLKKFTENQSKIQRAWVFYNKGEPVRVCLEKDTLDVWVNGRKVETFGEFTDDGTETHFQLDDLCACIKAVSSGKKKTGIVHSLFVQDQCIPECFE